MKQALLLICLSLTGMCFADDNITYQYYPIEGHTYNTLSSELNSKGPNNYHAYTHWYVKWHYNYDKGFDDCSLKDISVSNTTSIIFPKWKNRNGASNALVNEWLRYRKALMQHELGHAKFGVQAQSEIQNALQNLSPASSCNLMGQTANQMAYKILNHYQKKDKSYDQETEHGKTQGAYFNQP